LYSLAQIATGFNVKYTRCVQAPGHGKEETDGLEGVEKTYADSIFARPGPGHQVKEDFTVYDYKAPIQRMENGEMSSLAKMMYYILSDPRRWFRYKEEDQKVKECRYHLRSMHAASTHNVKMKAIGFGLTRGPGEMEYRVITVS
jgi:hypothetical protein